MLEFCILLYEYFNLNNQYLKIVIVNIKLSIS